MLSNVLQNYGNGLQNFHFEINTGFKNPILKPIFAPVLNLLPITLNPLPKR